MNELPKGSATRPITLQNFSAAKSNAFLSHALTQVPCSPANPTDFTNTPTKFIDLTEGQLKRQTLCPPDRTNSYLQKKASLENSQTEAAGQPGNEVKPEDEEYFQRMLQKSEESSTKSNDASENKVFYIHQGSVSARAANCPRDHP